MLGIESVTRQGQRPAAAKPTKTEEGFHLTIGMALSALVCWEKVCLQILTDSGRIMNGGEQIEGRCKEKSAFEEAKIDGTF